jgi:hypothetical protein
VVHPPSALKPVKTATKKKASNKSSSKKTPSTASEFATAESLDSSHTSGEYARGRAYFRIADRGELGAEAQFPASKIAGFTRLFALLLVVIGPVLTIAVGAYFDLPMTAITVLSGASMAIIALLTIFYALKTE